MELASYLKGPESTLRKAGGGRGEKIEASEHRLEIGSECVQSFHAAAHLHLWFPDIVALAVFFFFNLILPIIFFIVAGGGGRKELAASSARLITPLHDNRKNNRSLGV